MAGGEHESVAKLISDRLESSGTPASSGSCGFDVHAGTKGPITYLDTFVHGTSYWRCCEMLYGNMANFNVHRDAGRRCCDQAVSRVGRARCQRYNDGVGASVDGCLKEV